MPQPNARYPHRRWLRPQAPTSSEGPRVAVVTDTADDINGVALGLRRLAAASARAGLPLHLVGAGSGRAVFVDEGGVVRIPTWIRGALHCYPEMIWGFPRTLHLARWLKRANIEIVQCSTPGPMGFAAMASARSLGLPLVAQYHTEVAEYAARLMNSRQAGAATAHVVGWFYRHADMCLAPSRAVAKRLIDYGVDASKIAYVPRGIDLTLFRPERRDRNALSPFGLAERPTILYVGRLSREKNLDVLLAAHALVRRRCPEAALLLVGDGPLSGSLSGPGVIQAGVLRGERLAEVYASADVFAFASETETFGNVVVEAQAAGLPVVVAGAGAAHEHVVHGVTGMVIEDAAPEEFAEAILALLSDPARRARMGAEAHRAAQRYDPDLAAQNTFALYRSFLAKESTSCAHLS